MFRIDTQVLDDLNVPYYTVWQFAKNFTLTGDDPINYNIAPNEATPSAVIGATINRYAYDRIYLTTQHWGVQAGSDVIRVHQIVRWR